MRYEYAVRELKIDDRPDQVESMLNDMAAQRWELMRLDSGFFFFRRQPEFQRRHHADTQLR